MSNTKEVVKKVRSSVNQIIYLTEYMAKHTEFAAGRFVGPQGAQNNRDKWQKLAEHLAGLGPNKTAEQWKTTWRDLKCKSRAKRNAEARRAALSPGNTAKIPALTDLKQEVINTVGRASSEGSTRERPKEVELEIEYSNEQLRNTPVVTQTETELRSQPKKRKLDVEDRTTKTQASNDSFKELVGAVNHFTDVYESKATTFQKSVDRIGDIFERYTAAYEERVGILRQQMSRPTSEPLPSACSTLPSKSQTNLPNCSLQLESDEEC